VSAHAGETGVHLICGEPEHGCAYTQHVVINGILLRVVRFVWRWVLPLVGLAAIVRAGLR
jgi:hypothetical protein